LANKVKYKIKWSQVRDNPRYKCGLDLYHTHYPGLTRGQLQKQNSGLYVKIKREGNLDKIPYCYKGWKDRENKKENNKDNVNKLEDKLEEDDKRGTNGPLILEILN